MKRYIVEFDCYIYAESDEKARKKACKLQKKIAKKTNNDSIKITGLLENMFGSLLSRKIEL